MYSSMGSCLLYIQPPPRRSPRFTPSLSPALPPPVLLRTVEPPPQQPPPAQPLPVQQPPVQQPPHQPPQPPHEERLHATTIICVALICLTVAFVFGERGAPRAPPAPACAADALRSRRTPRSEHLVSTNLRRRYHGLPPVHRPGVHAAHVRGRPRVSSIRRRKERYVATRAVAAPIVQRSAPRPADGRRRSHAARATI